MMLCEKLLQRPNKKVGQRHLKNHKKLPADPIVIKLGSKYQTELALLNNAWSYSFGWIV